mgnify:CR=1 FL=1
MNANKADVAQVFAQNLKKHRKRVGLTQKQLSERLEISQKHLSFIETGVQFASASLIDRICLELNISCGDLFASERDVNIKEVNMICAMMQNIMFPRLTTIESKLENIEKKLNKEQNISLE